MTSDHKPNDDLAHPIPAPVDPAAAELYRVLDVLHGQILRAKYRLTEKPDADVLMKLIDDIGFLSAIAQDEWQSYDANRAERAA